MITSWSDEDLEKLSNPNNHRIRWDNIEYHWEHKINGHKWNLIVLIALRIGKNLITI
jgi:hypothetical protein